MSAGERERTYSQIDDIIAGRPAYVLTKLSAGRTAHARRNS